MLPTSGTQIFLDHNPKSAPAHPGQSYTRFVCLSDTHSRLFPVPPGDVLLHAGDLSSWGSVSQLRKTIDWLKSLPHPVKIIIAGNHDLCLDQGWGDMFNTSEARALVSDESAKDAGLHYLEFESLEFTTSQGRRWKVYGSPAAPRYANGAFQYSPGPEGKELYAHIPEDTEILLTHTPPFEAHDLTKRKKHAGCKDLANRIQQLEDGKGVATPWKCRLHVWGHIHEAYGGSVKRGSYGESVQVNAALALDGKPVIVDLYNG